MTSIPSSLLGPALCIVVAGCVLYGILDRWPRPRWWSKKSQLIGLQSPVQITSLECPYSYIRKVYGHHHWAPFVNKLSPTLKEDNPSQYEMILEIMDAIHLCLMLVDDISDGSDFRKGRPAAHKIYGPSETANRAYFRVTQILARTTLEYPHLAPWLMQDLEQILEGQDLSLVWRRDGLSGFPCHGPERTAAYRRMASLKTGALFRLVGHLVLENRSLDETLTLVAWHSQLQNDCKNLYSSEYAKLKGSVAEDLRNKELTYPVVLALNSSKGQWVARALESPSPRNVRRALRAIRSDEVRQECLAELQHSGASVQDWLALWGRKEKLDLKK
ncbi:terpenoid synthase [Aspergillus candidus]|uniref:Terpenoid synthase n=1 Tax=Aspergillus candidus TaxID=41067 RepID=A0A2I2FDC2_ASPCN|nr:terpenoid synthase [Aspergillus candidus]PLB38599.1 terpenoid synthase [Aspergillus candidus]